MAGRLHNRIDCSFCMELGFTYPANVPGQSSLTVMKAKSDAAVAAIEVSVPKLWRLVRELEDAVSRPYFKDSRIFTQNVWRLMCRDLRCIVDEGVASVREAELRVRCPQLSSLTAERRQEQQQQKLSPCTVCLMKQPSVVTIPCGHVFCGDCVTQIRRCALCRQRIDETCQLFLHFES